MREIEYPAGHRWHRTSLVDLEAVDHERVVGIVRVTGDVVRVRVAQRVDFDLLVDPVVVRASRPRITLGDTFELTAPQAREVARQLQEAAGIADHVSGRLRPRLVTSQASL
ncbi:hypothetical protein KIH74_11150 [Kineosporia sp. J2-2]|uniref:Uncharacterized protein n=1 Tax=Kineosporia corallincola TaxID=2835133 RepID=A0ABS5TEK5_9ACTN|nr:hypothetical protein [Kineosporia corallincola]MBT0769480.1 hypothetical protein [Kineosporia corallincola]